PDVRSAEDRLEIIEKQLIRQVMHVKLEVHRHSFLLHQVRADREIENRARPHTPALKIDLVVQTRIEPLRDEVRERRSGIDVRRHAGVVASAETRIKARRAMVITDLKLRLVALIMIVGELQTVQKQVL